jgi:hypothetical protein
MAAWFRLATTSETQDIVAKDGSDGNQGYQVRYNNNGKLNFGLSGDGVTANIMWLNGTTDLSSAAGEWHHVAAVYDGSDMKLYLDGASDATPVSYSSGIYNNMAPFTIGCRNGNAQFFDGQIDEVAVFSRALTADEVTSIYEKGLNSVTRMRPDVAQPPVPYFGRSIGENTGTVYGTGTVTLNQGSRRATFTGDALPLNIGEGDKLLIGGSTLYYIASRESATAVIVQEANVSGGDHSDAGYTITRAYSGPDHAPFNSWETACNGDLVTDDSIQRGIVYSDGTFIFSAEVNINDGNNVEDPPPWHKDSSHFMWLTAHSSARHSGIEGTGVVVDAASMPASSGKVFLVKDTYFRMEWLEIRNYPGGTNSEPIAGGQPIQLDEGNAGDNLLTHLIIHDYTSTGRGAINVYENATVRNSIIYNGDKGIRSYSNTSLTLTLENITIYGMTGTGIDHSDGTLIAKNTISVGSGSSRDFDVDNTPDGVVDQVSSGYNLYGTVHNGVHPGSNNQSPPASLEDLFVDSTTPGIDLHLEASGHNALNNGTDLSSSFTNDIDDEARPTGAGTWDIGADELVAASNQTPADPTINDHDDGSTISDNTPTLGYTQSDPDASEQVKYRIQIDDTDNTFSSLVVDYTSDFMAEGAASFTVGQAAGSGTYTVGSASQTLTDGDYFWRVMTTDDETAASGWTQATTGSNVAFTVDTAAACSSVVLNAFYEATTQIAASTNKKTVDIADVDMSKSFLVFSGAVDDNRSWCTQIRGNLYDAGSGDIKIDFERYESNCPVADIRYYVAEFSSGVSVQRGSKTLLDSDTINVSLGPTVDTSKSFPLVSGFISNTTHDGNDFIEAEITANNNLQLRKNTGTGTAKVDWQVVEYACSTVQKNTISSWATASTTDTLSPTVDLNKSWLVYSYKTDSGGDTTMAKNMVRGRITANNELTFDRDDTGSNIDLTWYLVEFTDATKVKHGTEDFAAGDSQENVTLSPSVDLASTLALGGMYMRGGKSAHDSDDNPGYGWFTFDLTADNNLQITRNASTGAAADVGWFVIEFAPSTALYRSVGTAAADLNTGSRTVGISGSTATFSGDMPTNVGVGDVLVYNNGSAQLAVIHGRTSATAFTVKDKNGGAPAPTSAGTSVGVYRAYTSLSNWENQIENANIAEPAEDDVNPSTDLVTANTIMMVACYADDVDAPTNEVNISGWTTSASNYIKIYTPTSTGEVGTSQRHTGTKGTGYVLKPNVSPGEYFSSRADNPSAAFKPPVSQRPTTSGSISASFTILPPRRAPIILLRSGYISTKDRYE